jgi:hypothetical protein
MPPALLEEAAVPPLAEAPPWVLPAWTTGALVVDAVTPAPPDALLLARLPPAEQELTLWLLPPLPLPPPDEPEGAEPSFEQARGKVNNATKSRYFIG